MFFFFFVMWADLYKLIKNKVWLNMGLPRLHQVWLSSIGWSYHPQALPGLAQSDEPQRQARARVGLIGFFNVGSQNVINRLKIKKVGKKIICSIGVSVTSYSVSVTCYTFPIHYNIDFLSNSSLIHLIKMLQIKNFVIGDSW